MTEMNDQQKPRQSVRFSTAYANSYWNEPVYQQNVKFSPDSPLRNETTIHTLTRIVAWINIIFSLLLLCFFYIGFYYKIFNKGKKSSDDELQIFVFIYCMSSFFHLVTSAFMLTGLNIKQPAYYLPYLIWMHFVIVISLISTIVCMTNDPMEMPTIYLNIFLIFFIFIPSFATVNQSRNYLLKEEEQQN